MQSLTLNNGTAMPRLGLGTWHMGEQRARRVDEVAAIRLAIELGYRLFDTAEMYGEGGAEEVLGQALADALRAGDVRREELVIVSKVYPHNASRKGTPAACARSRGLLGLDQIDLYLLHWRGQYALAETVEALQQLAARGEIGGWGVSNLDADDMQELVAAPGGDRCALNQVWFSLSQRGPQYALLPWLRAHGMALMAYSPIDQGALAQHEALHTIGERHGATAAQVALAWVLAQEGVAAIPKAARAAHLRENWAAAAIALDAQDLARIDRIFAPPTRATPLAML